MIDNPLINVAHNRTKIMKGAVVPFKDFNDWFAAIVLEINPSYIVGIARGAIRLLQLQRVQEVVGNVPILSDHALPFLSDDEVKSTKILLFDDTVIFGSTLSDVRKYLLDRGAVVFSAAYIIDQLNFYGKEVEGEPDHLSPSVHSEIPIHGKQLMPPSAIRRHHNTLIDSVLGTPRDYNLDFAKFCIKADEYCIGDIPQLIRLLEDLDIIREVYDVTYPSSALKGIYRYTALLEPRISRLLTCRQFSFRPYSKVRITFIPAIHEIHFTPLPQLTLSDGVLFEDIKFKSASLQSLWKRNVQKCSREDVNYQKSVFRLLTAFASVVLGNHLSKTFVAAFKDILPNSKAIFMEEDLKTTVGLNNCDYLKSVWARLDSLDLTNSLGKESYELALDYDEYLDQELIDDIKKAWEENSSLKPHDGELIYEDLGRVFLTLRAVTDNPERRKRNPGSSRIDVGLSYEAIRLLLHDECGVSRTQDEISISMDLCVDNGQAVPKVIRQGSTWLRSFYSGEAEDSHPTFQLKDVIHNAYKVYLSQKNAKPLTQFEMHKLCVTLKDVLNWIPITTKAYTYGRIAMVGSSQTGIVSWLVNRGSGPLKLVPSEEGQEKLEINEAYQPCVYPSWKPEKIRSFLDAFLYVAVAFSKLKNDEPKLLLSTCRTHRHAYNASAVELHSWTEHSRADFQRVITAAKLTGTGSVFDKTAVAESLFWSTQYINEALKKHKIFHSSFTSLTEKLKKAFESQGAGATHFWKYTVIEDKLLDSSIDNEIALKFKNLMVLSEQMALLTAYLTMILLDCRLIGERDLRQAFGREGYSFTDKNFRWLTSRDHRVLAAAYNNNIASGRVAAPSIERTVLPTSVPAIRDNSELQWYLKTHETIQICFAEISKSLNRFCPRYKTLENETCPFAPEDDKRTLGDGSVEKIHRDIFILTIEIIKSTNSLQTNDMKDYVLNTFSEFKPSGLYFDKTGNDAFFACSYDPVVLWDIARLIMQEGERLKKRGREFGGTRKGMFLGTVRQVIDVEGHERVSDAVTPHSLPQAFYILNGIDSHFKSNPEDMNLSIIIPDFVIPKLTPPLKLKLEPDKLFLVSSKHFHGKCCCFNLADRSHPTN